MTIYQTPLADIDALFGAIAARQALYIPADTAKNNIPAFVPWREGLPLYRGLNTVRSAKDFFFPQIQPMASFRRSGKKVEVLEPQGEPGDYVIFGVRACDVRSFEVLDRVFLGEPTDTYYQQRREHATVISLACERPGETCFCTAFGIDPAKAGGDIQGWIAGETLYLQPLTEKGAALAAQLERERALEAWAAEDSDTSSDSVLPAAVRSEIERIGAIMERLPLHDLRPADNRQRELEVFNSPVWQELSDQCLGCGSCTFVCPTCQCFDIEDFQDGESVQRYRCWDSCMYKDFTMMAAGQPRLTQKERFRQRFMHKLVYYPKMYDGHYSCVGCGRCLRRCPIHMHIVKVMKALEKEGEAG